MSGERSVVELPEDSPAVADGPDPLLLAVLERRDMACPRCGYNLRHLRTDRCPECGDRVVLRLAMAEPKLGLWLVMTVPLLMAAGLGLIFTIMIFFEGLPPARALFWVFGFCATVPMSVAAVMFRRRYGRLQQKTRVGLAIASVVYVAMLAVALAMQVR